jgi:hypothetical protein
MATIKLKRGQSANLGSLTLEAGEPAFTLDTGKLYVGDGTDKVLINPGVGAAEITDVEIGKRTIDQGIAIAVSNTGTLTQLFSFLAKVIKDITGKSFQTASAGPPLGFRSRCRLSLFLHYSPAFLP